MGNLQRGIGCRRGWAKFDGGVSGLGVTHHRGDEGRVHFWLLGRHLCVGLHTYLNITNPPERVGQGDVDRLTFILFPQKTTVVKLHGVHVSVRVTEKGGGCCVYCGC